MMKYPQNKDDIVNVKKIQECNLRKPDLVFCRD